MTTTLVRAAAVMAALGAGAALACECGPPLDFWAGVERATTVVLATVKGTSESGGVEVRVDEVFKGGVKPGLVTVGRSKCSVDVSTLKPGSTWVLQLEQQGGAWVVPMCVVGPVPVDQQVASIPAGPGPNMPTTKVPLDVLRQRLKKR
ncbi:MAG: hypothetical protein AB1938_18520 [Myxococcota bacterium]